MAKGKKRMSGKKKLAIGAGAAGIAGGAGYGVAKYTNVGQRTVSRAKNAASSLAEKIGAGFSSKMGGVIRRGRAALPANNGSLSRTLARMGHSKIARAGDLARANKGKIAGGVALFGASALGAAYYRKSRKSRKTQIKA